MTATNNSKLLLYFSSVVGCGLAAANRAKMARIADEVSSGMAEPAQFWLGLAWRLFGFGFEFMQHVMMFFFQMV